ncbi:hypothetical protein CQA49_04130 [Helicobacter sp. MIT 00-7814]|uniref:hypothetical protein n=1 Tax=unclassified Helicobacter TaxID=2593540 RepID=UPI000E1E353F|nr:MULTISPECIES: hypothetical protein [unclassified Helicobacter]RDU55023.1 hypothetical protein CQA49_04130 [Helicobacter sp. MIT 00-7814]RDU55946.1 hypothetical protein CQA37_03365 [Helicobacter sp. MIT 99-10781]
MFGIPLTTISIVCSLSCLSIVILLILANSLRSNDVHKRIAHFERGIEELNKELYKIRKWIKDNELENQYNNTALGAKVKSEVRDALDNGLIKVYRQIELLEADIQKQNDYTEEKMLLLEEKMREINFTPSNGNPIDEKRITTLFKEGWSMDSIAREMRLSKGEVELILKLANIR